MERRSIHPPIDDRSQRSCLQHRRGLLDGLAAVTSSPRLVARRDRRRANDHGGWRCGARPLVNQCAVGRPSQRILVRPRMSGKKRPLNHDNSEASTRSLRLMFCKFRLSAKAVPKTKVIPPSSALKNRTRKPFGGDTLSPPRIAKELSRNGFRRTGRATLLRSRTLRFGGSLALPK